MAASLAYPVLPVFFLCFAAFAVLLPRPDPIHNIPRLSRTQSTSRAEHCSHWPSNFYGSASFNDPLPPPPPPGAQHILGPGMAMSSMKALGVIWCHPLWRPSSSVAPILLVPRLGNPAHHHLRGGTRMVLLPRLLLQHAAPLQDRRTFKSFRLFIMPVVEVCFISFICIFLLLESHWLKAEAAQSIDRTGVPSGEWMGNFGPRFKFVSEQLIYILLATLVCVYNLADRTMQLRVRIKNYKGEADFALGYITVNGAICH
ncbi:hypothetical protein B0H17DRAFT_1145512 [Mycena rosella]|uniref:Uncharacterized protein n=1 Tax=Mycena rosella TaxID=1033263 RepID=A0AAD7G1P2_MYCRO|nr:hypothetical protein B0H17DRAFT_1145512 [Mycena rosella]